MEANKPLAIWSCNVQSWHRERDYINGIDLINKKEVAQTFKKKKKKLAHSFWIFIIKAIWWKKEWCITKEWGGGT